ncbi:unsaturated chondroitin disaccharide hydrolase [Rhodococcus percolatus]|uniref:glycoside hydrolase family 88 protein n=1 Tax=Rhodococcus opacus TaxID=37919 RepID=UPI0015F87663|nr:glycoside hydrolase family 88 protein [Rhodococcus opacus]MBA8961603.1 unsaturated chondroitin disaccharide hydrolase [Rhodococcus opacus]MBP2202533.1 unsaturated chondroitin disaccharide hydrolase [Rhodococcus opacus]
MTGSRYTAAIDSMLERIDSTAKQTSGKFPHYGDPESGEWTTTADGNWTGGFWGGLAALGFVASREDRLSRLADEITEQVLPRESSDTAFRGFLFWYGAAVNHLVTGSASASEIALAGARGLLASFNDRAGVIPLGAEAEEAEAVGEGAANIDAVPGTVALLSWASAQTSDPRFLDAAIRHAERHIELCIRADGSVCQSALFDTTNGALLRRYTHKGMNDDSTWGRAQAWAMVAYAQAAQWASPSFLPTAVRLADWWLDRTPTAGIVSWDFDAGTGPHVPIDTSATAIAAAALLKLARLVPDRTDFRDRAVAHVNALLDHLTPAGPHDSRPAGILMDGCFDKRRDFATRNELIWGDYFLLECLISLDGRSDTLTL